MLHFQTVYAANLFNMGALSRFGSIRSFEQMLRQLSEGNFFTRLVTSHTLLARCSCALIIGLSDNVRILEHCVMRGRQRMILSNLSSAGISAKWPPKQENERLRLVNLVVDPAAGLLHAE